MAESVVKRFRLSAQAAHRLAQLADDLGTTESELIRRGLELVERVERRQRNIEDLIALAEGDEPAKVRFGLRP